MKELSLQNCRLDKRYEIFKQLGRGSYAEIFVARDVLASPQSAHGFVVVKALNVFLQDDLDSALERTLVENFQNEAVALDRVRHPNIISRLGHGTARDGAGTLFHYLILEYLEGGDLQKGCRERSISFDKAFDYIEQTCAGLRHAHARGVIHRDIKPQNLLLTRDLNTVKIADFGVARLHTTDTPITRVGTNIYAAPEHSPLAAGGEVATVSALTPAADIYSLAKTVYTLVTCESPRFYAGQPITALPLACRDKAWAHELIRVLNRATQPESERRHQSVDEFWRDLESVRRYTDDDDETQTHVRAKLGTIPQPHVDKGYSPVPPTRARFDTSRELRLRHPFVPKERPRPNADPGIGTPLRGAAVPSNGVVPSPQPKPAMPLQVQIPNAFALTDEAPEERPRFGGLAKALIFLILLAGGLFVTSYAIREFGLLPGITGTLSEQTGKANTDINLRPAPNMNNEPIGMVTRNSRVRIVKMQNNWYQVDIIEQGRAADDAPASSRGWLYGRYVDLDKN
jgi:serine/threonine protein kinase